MSDFVEIKDLVKLFNPDKDNSDSDNEELGATSIEDGEKAKKSNPYDKVEPSGKGVKIEDFFDDQQLENDVNLSLNDWKKTPKWDLSFRQQVTASDVFLQIGAKNPSTASCEDMIIRIDLPGEKMQNVDIKVLEKQLEVNSPKFYLKLPLSQPVDPQKSNASWDKEQEKLNITLRMSREFDFINF